MNKIVKIALLVLAVAMTMGCSTIVEPGHVGVLVHLNGGDQGVDQEVLGPGRHFVGWNSELYDFPTFVQSYTWTKSMDEGKPVDEAISFQTKDGMKFSVDVGISYTISKENVGQIYQKYHKGVAEITDVVLRNFVRDEFTKQSAKLSADEAFSTSKIVMMDTIQANVIKEAAAAGITVIKVYYVSEMRPPDAMILAMGEKIKATQSAQKVENQLREATAQAAKEIATSEGHAKSILIEATAQAQANKLLAASITPTLIENKKVDRWDGHNSQVVSGGAGGMFVNVK